MLAVLLGAILLLLGCGASGPAVVGNWTCRSPSNSTGDAVEIKSDGTVAVTTPAGLSASGTWSLNGSTIAVQGLGPGGSETFTIAGDQITGQGGQVCTRAS
jgi:hypothetical protein